MENKSEVREIYAKNPKQYLMETDKGTRDVFTGALEFGELHSLVMSKANRKEMLRYVTLMDDYPEDRLDQFDWAVHDAINSIYHNDCDIMSIPMIIRTMSGNPHLKPSEKQVERVLEIVKRLLSTGIDIVYDEEVEAYQFINEGDGWHYYGTLISGEITTAIINGRMVDSCLHLHREPILATLARKKKQISTIDMRMLNTPISMSEENIVLRNYLLSRIEQCRHNKQQELLSNRTIVLQAVYKTFHASQHEYTRKSRIREKIERLLMYWSAEKFIMDYVITDEKIFIAFHPDQFLGDCLNL